MPKISDLSGVFKGGARPNRFQVRVTGGPEILPNMEFLCRSASQPASTLGEIQVPYHGRFYKIPGDRTFEDWTITIYNDENHEIRKALETWSHRMNNYEGNTTTDDISALLGTCTVKQQDTGGNELHGYILEGCWPGEIGAIDLAWDNNDAVEEFTVTWKVQFMRPDHISE